MTGDSVALPPFLRGLSARLLMLTVIFVMVSEALIFAPSIARFRLNYLQGKIADAHLAILALEATPDNMVSEPLARELLGHVGAYGIVLHKPTATLMLDAGGAPRLDAAFDLRDAGVARLIADAVMALGQRQNRILRVLDISPKDPNIVVEVIIDEAPMRAAMLIFGRRILEMSIVISLITAALLYLALQWLLLAPLRRLTQSMVSFRADPEDEARAVLPSRRGDEIGLAQRELAAMQETVRQALRHNARLAALGTAVAKISHDLRNILSTARLMSDSLADSEVPEVKRVDAAAPRRHGPRRGAVRAHAQLYARRRAAGQLLALRARRADRGDRRAGRAQERGRRPPRRCGAADADGRC